MENIKKIIYHFSIVEVISLILLLLFSFFVNVNNNIFINFIWILVLFIYISKINLLLTFLFFFINKNSSKIISIILIIIFSFFAIYLYNKQDYYKGLSIEYFQHRNDRITCYLIENILDVIIFLFLMINQLMVKFYFIVWRKMKRIWRK